MASLSGAVEAKLVLGVLQLLSTSAFLAAQHVAATVHEGGL